MRKTLGTFALVGLTAGMASAQSMPPGYYVEGEVVYEYYFNNDGDSLSAYSLDATIGMRPSAAGSFPVGAEVYLNFSGWDSSGSGYDAFAYGGILYYEGSFGRVSVGTPRSTIGDYLDMPSLGSYFDNSMYSIYSGGITTLVIELEEIKNYGIRFDGTYGNLSVGASYHAYPDDDLSSFTVSGRYDLGNYAVALGYENFDSDGLIFASASADFGNFGGAISLTSPDSSSTVVTSLDLYYDVMPSLELGLAYMNFGGSDDISMISAEYTFYQNAFVGARYYPTFIEGGEAYAIYAGYNLDF